MTEYKNEGLGVSFTVADEVTIRNQLRLKQVIARSFSSVDFYAAYWAGAMHVIEDWNCDYLPDVEAERKDEHYGKTLRTLDFNKVTDKRVSDLVFWVCNEVAGHMADLEKIPKNS